MLRSKSVKLWILISLGSWLVWVTYWLKDDWVIFINYFKGEHYATNYVRFLGADYWVTHIGLNALFIALILGLFSCALMWGFSKPFFRIKSLFVAALVLGTIYFLSLAASGFWLMRSATTFTSNPLGVDYLLQPFFTVPFFLILAFKVQRYTGLGSRRDLLKYGSFAFVGFTIALWANAVIKWSSKISTGGLTFLLSGVRTVGFFDAAIFMSLAVLFAIIGSYKLTKQKSVLTSKWFGLSLTMVGVHYAIYLIYSTYVHALNYIWLSDIWTIALLGLGLTILITKPTIQIDK